MPRVVVPAAEEMIGKEIPCLNKGHVMLVDYMGGDYSVVQAARTSYAQEMKHEFDQIKDTGLINYLMAHRHTTPFEMVQIKVRMKLPIFVARQWVRHRTASLNEVSARYTQLPDDFYLPEPENVSFQSESNKQGRGEAVDREKAEVVRDVFSRDQELLYDHYKAGIGEGVAKELARINLPVSIYTEWYWDQSLWNMLHLLSLRMDSHAQYEIRVYANALYEIVKAVAPVSLAAWEEHVFNAVRFSATELKLLKRWIDVAVNGLPVTMTDPISSPGRMAPFLVEDLEPMLGKRGSQEFIDKLNKGTK